MNTSRKDKGKLGFSIYHLDNNIELLREEE